MSIHCSRFLICHRFRHIWFDLPVWSVLIGLTITYFQIWYSHAPDRFPRDSVLPSSLLNQCLTLVLLTAADLPYHRSWSGNLGVNAGMSFKMSSLEVCTLDYSLILIHLYTSKLPWTKYCCSVSSPALLWYCFQRMSNQACYPHFEWVCRSHFSRSGFEHYLSIQTQLFPAAFP